MLKRTPIRQLFNIERLVGLMAARGIDGVVASSHQNLYYMSSLNAVAQKSDEPRPFAVVFSRHAPEAPILVLPEYYMGAMARQDSWIDDIRPYRSMISPLDRPASGADLEAFVPQSADNLGWTDGGRDHYAETMIESLEKALADLGLTGKRIAFDDARLGLRVSDSASDIADGFGLLMSARSVKSPFEIEMLRKSTAINQAAIEATIGQWGPGMTWHDLNHAYNVAAVQQGGFVHDPGALVLASPRGADPAVAFTSEFDDFEIEPGMRIMFDCHGTKDLYCWDGGRRGLSTVSPKTRRHRRRGARRRQWKKFTLRLSPGRR